MSDFDTDYDESEDTSYDSGPSFLAQEHTQAAAAPSSNLAEAKAALEALQADQSSERPANTPESMQALYEVNKAANRVEYLEQREPFAGMSEREVALALENSQVGLDEAKEALAAAQGPGQRARAERLIAEAEATVPTLQLELKRRTDAVVESAALDRFADRQARASRSQQVAEIEEEIKREQGRMNAAYAAGDNWEFGQMRRLQAGREALLERIRTNSEPTKDELARVKESWSGINPTGASFVVS